MNADNNATASLTDDELDRLDALLGEFGDSAMTAEELDGFFAAIASGPGSVPMDEWLPVVLGAGEGEATPAFASAAQEREFRDLTSRHLGDIATTLARGEVWSPVMDTDEDGKPSGNGWALGFLCGVEMRAKDWRDFLEDDEAGEAIDPVFELAHEDDPDPELRSDPIPDDERDDVIGRMMQGVGRIHAWFAPYRDGTAGALKPATMRREAPKVGRNDPCPCGSGKKYKQCCGATAAD